MARVSGMIAPTMTCCLRARAVVGFVVDCKELAVELNRTIERVARDRAHR